MCPFESRSAAEMPSSWGIFTSMMTRSGRSSVASATAVSPSPASPTTSNPLSRRISTMSRRMSDSSSATTTRRGADWVSSLSVTHESLRYSGRGLWPVWRNGRRGALKMLCPKGRVGSTPTTGTSAARAAHQAVLQRERRRSGARTDTELDEDVAHVTMDGAFAEQELGGDHVIGPALGDELQHLDLPRGEAVCGPGSGHVEKRPRTREVGGRAELREGLHGPREFELGTLLIAHGATCGRKKDRGDGSLVR